MVILTMRIIKYVFVFILLLTLQVGCSSNKEDSGLPKNPKRIVSLAPSNTEMLFLLGMGDNVVGVTEYCIYPSEAQKKQIVGGFTNPNMEIVMSLQPDLSLTIDQQSEVRAKLNTLKIPTVSLTKYSIDDIAKAFEIIGRAVGKDAEGQALKKRFLGRIEEVRRRFVSKKSKRVMLIVGRSPGTLKGMYVAGPGNFYHELLEIVNAENIFADSKIPYFSPSFEEVYARNPEIIIELKMDSRLTSSQRQTVIKEWDKFENVDAVMNDKVCLLNDPYYTVPGMSLLKILSEMVQIMESD